MYNRQQINNREHTRNNLDNLKNRIIVDFCNFLIHLLNKYTQIFFNFQRVKFRKIENQFKNVNSIFKLMNMTLEEFCQINISTKYKRFDKHQNFKSFGVFKKISNNTLINFRLKDLFENFYLKDEKIKIMNNKGKYVIIDDLKNFEYLKKNENELYIKRLIDASTNLIELSKKNYLNNDNVNLNYEENDFLILLNENDRYSDFTNI
jgi:hypothetical protein